MARIRFDGLEEYELALSRLAAGADTIAGQAIYAGAGIVADAIRQSIQALPAEPDIAGAISYAQKTAPPITASAKQGLLDGLGVSPMQEDKGYINVKIGFDGYNDLKTKKYPKGQPNVMIARTLESGSSIAEKRPFVRPAVNRVRKQAEAKMAEVLDEGIKRSMEGAVE